MDKFEKSETEEMFNYNGILMVKSNAEVLIEFEKIFGNPITFIKVESSQNSYKIINLENNKAVNFTVHNNYIITLSHKGGFAKKTESKTSNLPENIGNLTELKDLWIERQNITELPQSFSDLIKLRQISIRWSKLQSVNLLFERFTELEEMNLSANMLTEFPKNIEKAPNLTKLILNSNPIRSIPKSIAKSNSIERIDLESCKITTIPKALKKLPNLKRLNINRNEIKYIPDFVSEMANFSLLVLNYNPLRSLSNIPRRTLEFHSENFLKSKNDPNAREYDRLMLSRKGFDLFTSGHIDGLLRYYTKSPNKLTKLFLKQFLGDSRLLTLEEMNRILHEADDPELQLLNSALHNPCYNVPTISPHPTLDVIQKVIDRINQRKEIDAEIDYQIQHPALLPSHLAFINELVISKKSQKSAGDFSYDFKFRNETKPKFYVVYEITSLTINNLPIPKNIENLATTLRELYISNLNEDDSRTIQKVPFHKLQNLETLYMDNCRLNQFPKNIQYLKNLKNLRFTRNNLPTLPQWLGNLTKLDSFTCHNNSILFMPDSLKNLQNLTEINIGGNLIEIVPGFIATLDNLRFLSIWGNPLRSFSNIPEYLFADTIRDGLKEGTFRSDMLDPKGKELLENFKNGISENFTQLYNHYKKSPKQLAQQYVDNPKSLTKVERGRLAWEGGLREREILELKLQPEDPTLLEINKRLSVPLKNGLRIMK
ncbi:leucine-rich repeat domain-containing protein [Promethearchaeum syntrophicum]|uniref:Leucine-rich repeat domain-containing protein n=1 Tax=Promethearchaeum syntrophicum TaxID=2594042 RepID=A0A5B9D7C4_9ARCH|nr:leucine-rich repeat domain-containing protein [Candidatus Prometheoarchaeum syntrophicum]QEE14972.1 Leucine Rich repeats (2 copies) [Candidatus Prometheoarchaeum syntrophicum]